MKAILLLLLLPIIGLGFWLRSRPTADGGETFTVRLIRGVDASASVQPGERTPEPALARRLAQVFRWPAYREHARDTVQLCPGRSVCVRLDPGIEASLRLAAAGQVDYRVAVQGRWVSQGARQRGEGGPWLAGLETPGTNTGWFVAIEWIPAAGGETGGGLTRTTVAPWPPGGRAPISPVAARPATR